MYIQESRRKKGNKIYKTVYLTESYREGNKVRKKYVANLTHCPDPIVALIKDYLKKNKDTEQHIDHILNSVVENSGQIIQGKSVGGSFCVLEIVKRLGIEASLGKDIRQSKLALFQIIGRVLNQRSRLYLAKEWVKINDANSLLSLDKFNEDDLYENLDWLSKNQEKIEQRLFNIRHKGKDIPTLYLYDVTSVYFEGEKNELATFGYNRDKKRGKMQIVVGLLCDDAGYPVSVQVFKGNTNDTKTVSDQFNKSKDNFGVKNVVMVGDKGMLKKNGIEEIKDLNWHYITSITSPEIETLLKDNIIQIGLFDEDLTEVIYKEERLLLRRNPYRAAEVQANRNSMINKIRELIEKANKHLLEHPYAKTETMTKKIQDKISKYKATEYIEIKQQDRVFSIMINQEQWAEKSKLDGCYVIKTNVNERDGDKEYIHQKYKDLALVEQAFRTFKQSFEEIQPVYVRKESRTRGHVFVCMLGYIIMKYIWDECKTLGLTQASILESLNAIQYQIYKNKDIQIKKVPDVFNEDQTNILHKLKIKLHTMVL